jgi:hypothetical protein
MVGKEKLSNHQWYWAFLISIGIWSWITILCDRDESWRIATNRDESLLQFVVVIRHDLSQFVAIRQGKALLSWWSSSSSCFATKNNSISYITRQNDNISIYNTKYSSLLSYMYLSLLLLSTSMENCLVQLLCDPHQLPH